MLIYCFENVDLIKSSRQPIDHFSLRPLFRVDLDRAMKNDEWVQNGKSGQTRWMVGRTLTKSFSALYILDSDLCKKFQSNWPGGSAYTKV